MIREACTGNPQTPHRYARFMNETFLLISGKRRDKFTGDALLVRLGLLNALELNW